MILDAVDWLSSKGCRAFTANLTMFDTYHYAL